jgi:hypothetical protein
MGRAAPDPKEPARERRAGPLRGRLQRQRAFSALLAAHLPNDRQRTVLIRSQPR